MENKKLFDEIDRHLRVNIVGLINAFLRNVEANVNKAEDKSIRTARISFLRSGAIDNLPWFRVDFYECSDCASLTKFHFQCRDGKAVGLIDSYKPVHQRFDSSSKIEKDNQEYKLLKEAASEHYHQSFVKLIPTIIGKLDVKGCVSSGVEVFYGDYLGKNIKLA